MSRSLTSAILGFSSATALWRSETTSLTHRKTPLERATMSSKSLLKLHTALTSSGIVVIQPGFLRRIWAHQISFFVPRLRDVAHPGSGPAQDRLSLAQSFSPSEPFLEGCATASTTTSTLTERAQNWSHI